MKLQRTTAAQREQMRAYSRRRRLDPKYKAYEREYARKLATEKLAYVRNLEIKVKKLEAQLASMTEREGT
jgi:hypothetical protein